MGSVRQRDREPELEHDLGRHSTLGYETLEMPGSLRYLEHGIPTPLVRWHQHEECELHLIVETRGKLFVGDYIGHFEPGNLVLTGPRLPHNWISSDGPDEVVHLRDMVLQFSETPLRQAGAALVKTLGVYPPGAFVRLASREVGVVIRRGTTATTPRVAVVTNRDGMPTGEPIPRDTGMPPWKVTGVVPFKDVRVNLSLDRLLQMV